MPSYNNKTIYLLTILNPCLCLHCISDPELVSDPECPESRTSQGISHQNDKGKSFPVFTKLH